MGWPSPVIHLIQIGYFNLKLLVCLDWSDSFHQSLIHDLDGDLSGDFDDLCDSLTYLVTDYFAVELKRILDKLVESDADSVQEVLISRSNTDIANINTAYANREWSLISWCWLVFSFFVFATETGYQRSLRSDIESKYFGSTKQLLSQLSNVTLHPKEIGMNNWFIRTLFYIFSWTNEGS